MQALQIWLTHNQVGIPIGDKICPGVFYADDTTVCLPSMSHEVVSAFLHCMEVFHAASGLRLNVAKSFILPIGTPLPLPLPQEVAGIPVVSSAVTLGLTFSNPSPHHPHPSADWAQLAAKVDASYDKISRLGLSMFGRGYASAGYGISKILYHAEFSDIPPDILSHLCLSTARLVDRNWKPGRGLPGVPVSLLPGAPRNGFFWLFSLERTHTCPSCPLGCPPFAGTIKGSHPHCPLVAPYSHHYHVPPVFH